MVIARRLQLLAGFRVVNRLKRSISRLLVVAALIVIGACLGLMLFGYWLVVPSTSNRVDVIVVYAGDPGRAVHGIDLYHRGLAPRVWHTGSAAQHGEVTALMRRNGIPADRIDYLITDSTWQDSEATIAHARDQQVHRILVVTDWWHGRRALCTLRQQLPDTGIHVAFNTAPEPRYGPNSWWLHRHGWKSITSELAKFGYYWLFYGMAPWRC